MKDVFKEAAPQFEILKKNILDHQRVIEKTRKVDEQDAKKASIAAARAEMARGHSRGTRGSGRGGGRGARGRGASTDDLDPEPSGVTESSESESDSESDSDSEAGIPIPRAQIRMIQGRRRDETTVRELNQEVVAEEKLT